MSETNEFTARLRAAATDMPDNPYRAEQVLELAERRRHRHRRTVLVAAAAATVVAVVALVFGLGAGTQRHGEGTVPAGRPDESRRVQFFGGMSLIPPAGWTVEYAGTGAEDGSSPRDMWACLVPPPAERQNWTCGGGILVEAGRVVGHEGQPFQAHQDGGWYVGTGVSSCPTAPDGALVNAVVPGAAGAEVNSLAAPVEQGAWNVAGHAGAYDRWAAHCADDGFTFYPRSWYLPEIPFRVLDYLGHPETTEELLGTIRIGSAESRRMSFYGGVSLIPPAGWQVTFGPRDSGTTARDRWVCLLPAAFNPMTTSVSCPGILIEAGTVTGFEGQPFQAHQNAGWLADRGQRGCPNPPPDSFSTSAYPVTPGAPGDDGPDAGAPIEQSDWNVAGRAGAYDRWAAHCADHDFTFHPRSWYLPQIPFRVLDYVGYPETAQLLTTIQIR
ncbi:hypothetical protein I6A84_06730 [Frankia sp. CNm7]|uniref:Uncharacterized protein n=1 Tax=Frankia nepalensis TaxID=1836974 RepID=A0A937USI3_9ACTN|nr:hypothetical protein [Frankia nepalensis]MBL7499963.1 hypothetical protein [Frankia nepalensis]MBL7512754.1 hypothetical protein [Frankia nepalensis]MBL7517826.1 hypothetical protein [Frankia nepalensis]MBL7632143.1 hypothetical protein [Frankia nepalensis]